MDPMRKRETAYATKLINLTTNSSCEGGFAAELDKVKASLPRGAPIEIWFQSLP